MERIDVREWIYKEKNFKGAESIYVLVGEIYDVESIAMASLVDEDGKPSGSVCMVYPSSVGVNVVKAIAADMTEKTKRDIKIYHYKTKEEIKWK